MPFSDPVADGPVIQSSSQEALEKGMTLNGALERAGLAPARVAHVAFGNMYQSGPHGCYGARYVTHRAGCPPEVAGHAVNLACGTGLMALKDAADAVARGEADVAAAVGADAPSRVRRAEPSCTMPNWLLWCPLLMSRPSKSTNRLATNPTPSTPYLTIAPWVCATCRSKRSSASADL